MAEAVRDLAVQAAQVLLRGVGQHEGLEARPEEELVEGEVAHADAEDCIEGYQDGFGEVEAVQPLLSPYQ